MNSHAEGSADEGKDVAEARLAVGGGQDVVDAGLDVLNGGQVEAVVKGL